MNVIGGLSNEFLSKGCPMNVIGGLYNEFFYWRFVQWVSKTKIFCFENSISYMVNACVGESVRTQDMGHDI